MKNRKRNRMKGFDYSSNKLYFITNCVKDNLCCFGNVICKPFDDIDDIDVFDEELRTGRDLSVRYLMELNSFGEIVKNQIEWLMIQYPYVEIHNYVIMPNHFHLILAIDSSLMDLNLIKIKSLSSLMGALKTTTSKQIRESGFEDFSWHRSFHDHIIRNEKAYHSISNYIDMNPQKWFQDRIKNCEYTKS